MCLEPEWVCGGWGVFELSACIGKSYNMVTAEGGGCWQCIEVDPVKLTATYRAIEGPEGKECSYVLNAEQIKRCSEESSFENYILISAVTVWMITFLLFFKTRDF